MTELLFINRRDVPHQCHQSRSKGRVATGSAARDAAVGEPRVKDYPLRSNFSLWFSLFLLIFESGGGVVIIFPLGPPALGTALNVINKSLDQNYLYITLSTSMFFWFVLLRTGQVEEKINPLPVVVFLVCQVYSKARDIRKTKNKYLIIATLKM